MRVRKKVIDFAPEFVPSIDTQELNMCLVVY
jgi:hypothetical protein